MTNETEHGHSSALCCLQPVQASPIFLVAVLPLSHGCEGKFGLWLSHGAANTASHTAVSKTADYFFVAALNCMPPFLSFLASLSVDFLF